MNIWLELITSLASVATTIGVFFAWFQIKKTGDLHRIQFEDSLAKEYRELIQKIPVKALLGKELNKDEYEEAKPFLFHYINLTNDQIFLRSKERISFEVWNDWQKGIEYNLNHLPAFQKIWKEIRSDSESFEELRKLEGENYDSDPKNWQTSKLNKKLKSKK